MQTTGNAVHVTGEWEGMAVQAVMPRPPWGWFQQSQTAACSQHSGLSPSLARKRWLFLNEALSGFQ